MNHMVEEGETALPLYGAGPGDAEIFLAQLSPAQAAFLRGQNFPGKSGAVFLLPCAGGIEGAVIGLGSANALDAFGSAAAALPSGSLWRLKPGNFDAGDAALGFLLGRYAYDRLKPRQTQPARLSQDCISPHVKKIAEAMYFARDLINTPPNYLGPAELGAEALSLAARFGAQTERVHGQALQDRYPALAAVGAGSDRAAEVVTLSWTGSGAKQDAPFISFCGKGVCFDTGGYDLKPSSAMLKMKKDMGGAAILLGLAQLIMSTDLPIRLRVRIGCVENSISGHAMRPSDILQTYAGKSVEVGNTDAEGRLVLCDLLAEASSEAPDWLIDAATLTGAARIALGPDLPALFCTDETMAESILDAGMSVQDPLWRLPLWAGYESWLDSNIADMNTISTKPFAGAIIAALFLKRFVSNNISWAHIDVYAWNDDTRPGKPSGGEAQSLRALFHAIERLAHV